jgi:hypothetical protein
VTPRHRSLHFKNLKGPLWSVRVSISYCAVELEKPDAMNWFWIGHHADYDRLIRQPSLEPARDFRQTAPHER